MGSGTWQKFCVVKNAKCENFQADLSELIATLTAYVDMYHVSQALISLINNNKRFDYLNLRFKNEA